MRMLPVLLVLMLVVAVACGPPGPTPADRVTALADAYVRDYLEAFPYTALSLGAPDEHPDQLADHSLEALGRWQAREDALLAELEALDPAALEGTPQAIPSARPNSTPTIRAPIKPGPEV